MKLKFQYKTSATREQEQLLHILTSLAFYQLLTACQFLPHYFRFFLVIKKVPFGREEIPRAIPALVSASLEVQRKLQITHFFFVLPVAVTQHKDVAMAWLSCGILLGHASPATRMYSLLRPKSELWSPLPPQSSMSGQGI